MQKTYIIYLNSVKTGRIDIKNTGRKIRSLCQEKQVSVGMIQRELYIGFQSVYAWFSGKTLPSLDNLYRLSRLLRVPMDEMIVDMEEEENCPEGRERELANRVALNAVLNMEGTEVESWIWRIMLYYNEISV